ncbi:SIS domain-containing protein [Legionella sp. W05-934-2]|jgi:D-sedoheptulose 7-phosphate isomerase|uniref:D-sedoheptulose-7-phosphate isomerase n=1 Tax=Legionella sp. W05-934-2 TaxID=1198649 RepID=UPI0034623F42
MTPAEERIRHQFGISIENTIAAADLLSEKIVQAASRLTSCLVQDGKIFICGSGGSAANACHFSSALLNHYSVERPSLPVVNLSVDSASISSIANESHYDQVFSRQVQALGHQHDLLIVLTTTGNSDSILNAVNSAKDRGMDTIALSGRDGGILANHLGPEDIELRAPGKHAAQIREIHLFILHGLADLIEQMLFNQLLG